MKVLVLGGAGYIGSVLCPYLSERGDEVTIFDTLLYEHDKNIPFQYNFIRGDICSIDDLLPALDNADAVVNLAAVSNDPASDLSPQLTWEINYKANETIAKLCTAAKKRIVYASSCSVYGFSEEGIFDEESRLGPVTLYAKTKMLSESYYLDKDVDGIILRFATVYGASPKPRFDLVINTMIGTSFFDKKIVVNGGAQWRPVVHVKDAAKAIYQTLYMENVKHRVYNVGSNVQNYKIIQLGEIIAKELPNVELIHNKSSIDVRSYKVDFSRIKNDIDFSTEYGVKDAIKELYDAFEKKIIVSMEEDEYYRVKYLKKNIDKYLSENSRKQSFTLTKNG